MGHRNCKRCEIDFIGQFGFVPLRTGRHANEAFAEHRKKEENATP